MEKETSFTERVTRVLEEQAFREDFSVQKLCEVINISARQLQRKVHTAFKMSPAALITNYRMDKAHELIKEGGENTISEIAYKVGYRSPSYFTQRFKKHFGYLPTYILPKQEKRI